MDRSTCWTTNMEFYSKGKRQRVVRENIMLDCRFSFRKWYAVE